MSKQPLWTLGFKIDEFRIFRGMGVFPKKTSSDLEDKIFCVLALNLNLQIKFGRYKNLSDTKAVKQLQKGGFFSCFDIIGLSFYFRFQNLEKLRKL